MKLIYYVIQNAEEISKFINSNNFNNKFNMSIEDFIIKCYCPSYFECLVNTLYEKPYKSIEYDDNDTNDIEYNDDCEYIYPDNEDKCKECWNREILISED